MEGAFSTRLMCGAAEAGGGGDPAALVVGREARAAVVADGPTPHAIGAYLRRAECRGARVGDGGNFVLGDAPIKGHGEAAEARDQRREGEQKEGTHLGGSRDVACYWWLTRCPGVICTEKDLCSVEG